MLYVAIALVAGVAACAQATAGFGYTLLSVPIIALLAGAKPAVVGAAIVGLALTSAIGVRERRSIRRRTGVIVSVASLAGMPVGLFFLSRVSDRELTVMIGIAVIVAGIVLWTGARVPAGTTSDIVAGLLSGALATSTGTNGPPMVITFHSANMSPGEFRGTISACFVVQGIVAVIGFAATGHLTHDAVLVAVAALPGVVVGWLAGERLFSRVDPARFRRLVLSMLLASGAATAIGAFSR